MFAIHRSFVCCKIQNMTERQKILNELLCLSSIYAEIANPKPKISLSFNERSFATPPKPEKKEIDYRPLKEEVAALIASDPKYQTMAAEANSSRERMLQDAALERDRIDRENRVRERVYTFCLFLPLILAILGAVGLIVFIVEASKGNHSDWLVPLALVSAFGGGISLIVFLVAKGKSSFRAKEAPYRDIPGLARPEDFAIKDVEKTDLYLAKVKAAEENNDSLYKKDLSSYQEKLKKISLERKSYDKCYASYLTINAENNAVYQRYQRSLKTSLSKAISSCREIPSYYAKQEDAVKKMTFLMVNKRADTVKELVNLYEDTEWKEAMLKSVSSLDSDIKNIALLNFKQQQNQIDAMYEILGSLDKANLELQNSEDQVRSEIEDLQSSIPNSFVSYTF